MMKPGDEVDWSQAETWYKREQEEYRRDTLKRQREKFDDDFDEEIKPLIIDVPKP